MHRHTLSTLECRSTCRRNVHTHTLMLTEIGMHPYILNQVLSLFEWLPLFGAWLKMAFIQSKNFVVFFLKSQTRLTMKLSTKPNYCFRMGHCLWLFGNISILIVNYKRLPFKIHDSADEARSSIFEFTSISGCNTNESWLAKWLYSACDNFVKCVLLSYTSSFVWRCSSACSKKEGTMLKMTACQIGQNTHSCGGCREVILIVPQVQVQVSEPTCLCRRFLPHCFGVFGRIMYIFNSVCRAKISVLLHLLT